MTPIRVFLIMRGASQLSFSIAFTLFALYLLRDLGATPFELVLPAFIYETMTFLFEIPTGIVADVYGRRLSLITGFIVMGIGFVIVGSVPTLLAPIIGMAIAGVGSTFISGADSAWLVDEVGQETAGDAFVVSQQVKMMGGLLGILASVLLGSINLQLTLIVAGLILIALSVLLILQMPETGFTRIPSSERESWRDLFKTLNAGLSLIRSRQMLIWIMLITIFLAGFGEAFGMLWQAQILENFSLPNLEGLSDIVWFGVISAIFTPITLAALELLKRQVDLANNRIVTRTLMQVYGAMILTVLLFALGNNLFLALLGLWLTRMLMAMANPLMEAWVNQHVESNVRATILSVKGQINAFGEILGGPFVGGIATLTSVRMALTFTILILLPALPILNRARNNGVE